LSGTNYLHVARKVVFFVVPYADLFKIAFYGMSKKCRIRCAVKRFLVLVGKTETVVYAA
jgi:hypothetical protein